VEAAAAPGGGTLAAGGVAAGAVAAAAVAAAAVDFCTPPWLLQAPRPVAVDVVPSLQVVGAGESASAWIAHANMSSGSATIGARGLRFIESYSSV
jgi:hypothetical protein